MQVRETRRCVRVCEGVRGCKGVMVWEGVGGCGRVVEGVEGG